jgi:hypothetical protein
MGKIKDTTVAEFDPCPCERPSVRCFVGQCDGTGSEATSEPTP